MAHFGVDQSVQRLAVEHPSAADARANGQVQEKFHPGCCAPFAFTNRRGVHIGVDGHRHAKGFAQRSAPPACSPNPALGVVVI